MPKPMFKRFLKSIPLIKYRMHHLGILLGFLLFNSFSQEKDSGIFEKSVLSETPTNSSIVSINPSPFPPNSIHCTTATENLIPQPQKIELLEGEFFPAVNCDHLDLWGKSILKKKSFREINESRPSWLNLSIIPNLKFTPVNSEEAYSLEINDSGIYIQAQSLKGIFYGWQTLKQLQKVQKDGTISFPFVKIQDWPAFRIRGFMHDLGRSFIPIKELKEQVQILSAYKINFFHWHLTEDIAWRLEIKAFPELTHPSNMTRFPGLYYSQAEVRDFLDFAEMHGVQVIPEIDMPGHSAAFERALGVDMQTEEGISALKIILEEVRELFRNSDYIHLGTDEVKFTNLDFVPEMVAFARDLGFKVISWNPGWEYKEGEIDLLHLWSYRGKRLGTVPVVDSRFHYINHFDPFADLISLFRSNVLGQNQGDSVVAGSILATWNDRSLPTSESILRENNFYPLMLTFAERLWKGGGYGYFNDLGVKYPQEKKEQEAWEIFENKLLFHKTSYFSQYPFPYFKQSHQKWNITFPFDNLGKLDSVFQIEKILLESDNLETIPHFHAQGGTVYLRHVWGDLVPGYITDPKPNSTVYAYAWIYSPIHQQVDAWISFHDYSRSEKDLPPSKGKWDWNDSRIWVNGQEVLPPNWQNYHTILDPEIPLTNENFQSRNPTEIQLQEGWNKVVLKLPIGKFSTPEIRLNKWMFSFVLIHGENLEWSLNNERKK